MNDIRSYYSMESLDNHYIIYQSTNYNDIKIILTEEQMDKLVLEYKINKEKHEEEHTDLPF